MEINNIEFAVVTEINMFIIMRCKYNFLKTFIVYTKLIISKILNKSTTPL